MNLRSVAALACLSCCLAATSFAQTSGAGQSPAGSKSATAPATRAWTAPRTPWGDPDLQGLWPGTDFVGVPLQRPESLGTRNELTDTEFAARLAAFQKQSEDDSADFDLDKLTP